MAVLAACLVRLRAEVDGRWPRRDRTTDGWIGDAAHQGTASDHNPDGRGIVHAIDLDKDGLDPGVVVWYAIKHPSVQYVIWNRTIWSRTTAFQQRRYTGSNPHTSHVHVSARHGAGFENDTRPWGLWTPAPPVNPGPPPVTDKRPGSRVLRLLPARMTGQDVQFVQKFIGAKHAGSADGIFGPTTAAGVRWYQGMRGIQVDGEVGPQTWANMGVRWTG